MGFDIQLLHIADNSPEAEAVERVMSTDHVSPAEAVLRILRSANTKRNPALAGLGLFGSSEDAAVLDAAVALAYEERRKPSKRTNNL